MNSLNVAHQPIESPKPNSWQFWLERRGDGSLYFWAEFTRPDRTYRKQGFPITADQVLTLREQATVT